MRVTLDHVLVLVAEIGSGMACFEALAGAKVAIGGRHPDHGTVNALVSMGESYLELIASERAGGEPGLQVIDFAMRVDDIGAVAAAASATGLTVIRIDGQRRTPEGAILRWQAFELIGHDHGGTLPFFIDWGTTPHPAATAPSGLTKPRLTVLHPDPAAIRPLYRALGFDLPVEQNAAQGLRLDLETPKGSVTLTGDARGWRRALLDPTRT